MKNQDRHIVFGISIPIALFIALMVLRLNNLIELSWWWVTSPLWIPLLLFVVFIAIGIYAVLRKH